LSLRAVATSVTIAYLIPYFELKAIFDLGRVRACGIKFPIPLVAYLEVIDYMTVEDGPTPLELLMFPHLELLLDLDRL
jgi:hypothetical protein